MCSIVPKWLPTTLTQPSRFRKSSSMGGVLRPLKRQQWLGSVVTLFITSVQDLECWILRTMKIGVLKFAQQQRCICSSRQIFCELAWACDQFWQGGAWQVHKLVMWTLGFESAELSSQSMHSSPGHTRILQISLEQTVCSALKQYPNHIIGTDIV